MLNTILFYLKQIYQRTLNNKNEGVTCLYNM